VLSVLWVSLRGLLRRGAARGPHILSALMDYTRSAIGLVGLRALRLDPAGAAAALERVRAYADHPVSSLKIVHASARAIALYVAGRGSEVQDSIRASLARLDGKPPFGMSDQERVDLTVGLLLLIGINDCYRDLPRALDSAARLERIDTPLAKAAALRLSMTYHLMRGNRERTQHFRRLLELSALRDGTSWQVEHIAVPIEGHAAALWSDITTLRRSLDRLEQLAVDTPSFASMREIVRANYLFRRGDFAATIEVGEAHMRAHAPFTVLSWASVYAVTAFAHVELGDPKRALEICERGLACISEEHRGYALLYGALEAAHATALALLGQRERAEQIFGQRLTQLRASGEHVPACFMYEYRIKVARMLGELAAERQALLDMREAALASGQPSMIALAERVSALGALGRSSPRPPAQAHAQEPSLRPSEHETVVTAFLRGVTEPGLRARHALVMLGQYAASAEGYLFWRNPDGLQLVASLDECDPPHALVKQLEALAETDAPGATLVELAGEPSSRYRVIRLRVGRVVGLAAMRDVSGPARDIPPAFVREVGRALRASIRP
jgi:tetratricopeptide (TPR) repeat protein